jgi:hypothetical protein
MTMPENNIVKTYDICLRKTTDDLFKPIDDEKLCSVDVTHMFPQQVFTEKDLSRYSFECHISDDIICLDVMYDNKQVSRAGNSPWHCFKKASWMQAIIDIEKNEVWLDVGFIPDQS